MPRQRTRKNSSTNSRKHDLPKIGDDIYIPSQFYLSHGVDDLVGGLARVSKIEPIASTGPNKGKHFVSVAEVPGTAWNWEGYLAIMQPKLKKEFGSKRAYPDPDYSPDSNSWS